MRGFFILPLVLAFAPVAASDLDLPPDEVRAGRTLYLQKCARCHALDASGGGTVDIQGVVLKDVLASVKGVDAMPRIELSDREAQSIATFLMSLAPDQARKRLGQQ